jgi:hypothetical protein
MEILKNEEPGPRCSLEQLLSTIEGLGLISSSEKKKNPITEWLVTQIMEF